MDRKRLKYLISNLLDGSLSMSEHADILKWINSDEAEIDSREVWDSASNNIESSLKNDMWNFVYPKINDSIPTVSAKHIIRHRAYSLLKIAAFVAVVLCSIVTLYLLGNNIIDNKERISDNIYCFEVESGQKGNIRLSDGTLVYLNSASKISFAGDYNSENRVVNLQGEAYFEVAKNPNKKFIVSCNGVDVEALGTEFNVKAYPTDTIITTTLAEGKVKVSSEEQSVTLLPNDVATYNMKRHTIKSSTVTDISIANFWRTGQLVFEGESLGSISQTIERMYGIKINIKDDRLKTMKFTGTIQNNSLNNIMHVISISYPLTYTISDSIITISAKKI